MSRQNITFNRDRDPLMYDLIEWLKKESLLDERAAFRNALLAFHWPEYVAAKGEGVSEELRVLNLARRALLFALHRYEQREFELTGTAPVHESNTSAPLPKQSSQKKSIARETPQIELEAVLTDGYEDD